MYAVQSVYPNATLFYNLFCHTVRYHIIVQNGISSSYYFYRTSLLAMIMATQSEAAAGQVQGENEMRKLGQQKNMNSIQEKNGLRFFSSIKITHKNKKEVFFSYSFWRAFFSLLALSCQKRFFLLKEKIMARREQKLSFHFIFAFAFAMHCGREEKKMLLVLLCCCQRKNLS